MENNNSKKSYHNLNSTGNPITIKKISNHTKIKTLFNSLKISLLLVVILILFILILYIIFLNEKKEKEITFKNITIKDYNANKVIENKKHEEYKINLILRKNKNEEIKEIRSFADMAIKGILFSPNETYNKSNSPKISVVITVHNGEGYIKNAIISIENQNFKDIEIVFIDDGSTDNSTKLIKKFIEKDTRIVLYQNEGNKGALYSKTKGVLLSKGKYILILDQDDIYLQKDAFSTLYKIMKEDNLDMLGFAVIFSFDSTFGMSNYIYSYTEMPVIYQPNVSQMMFYYDNKGEPKRKVSALWNYMFRSEFFKKIIKQIDDKFMNTKMNWHDDFLLFFLSTRNAYNMRIIKRIFYAKMFWHKTSNKQIIYSQNEKKKNLEDMHCSSYLNYLEFLLMKTRNTIYDKRFASYQLDKWYLNHRCRNNTFVKEKGKYVCKLFLENEYIENDVKNQIKTFLNK